MSSGKQNNGPEDTLPRAEGEARDRVSPQDQDSASPGDPGDVRKRPPRRLITKRNLLFVAIGLAGVVVVVILLALLMYRAGYVDRYIANSLIQSLAEYGIRMEIGELEAEFYPHVVVMRNVAFHNAVTGQRIATAERIVAEVEIDDLLALNLRRTIDLRELEVFSPEVWVTIDDQGRTNFYGLELPPPDPERRVIFEYATALINLHEGSIHVSDEARDLLADLNNVRATVQPAAAAAGAEMRSLAVALSDSTVTYNGQTIPAIALTLDGRLNEERAIIDSFNLNSPAADVTAQGSVTDFSPVTYDLRVNSTVRLGELASLLLEETTLEGTGQLVATVRGTDLTYQVDGSFASTSLAVDNTRIQNLEAKAIIKGDGADLTLTGDVRAASAQSGQFGVANLTLNNVTVETRGEVITGAAQQALVGQVTGEGLRVERLVASGLQFVSEGETQRVTAQRASANAVITEDARVNDLTASSVTAVIRNQLTQIEVDQVRVGGVQAGTARAENIQVAGVNLNLTDRSIEGRSGDVNVGSIALANGRLTGVRILSPAFTVGPGDAYRAAGRLNLDGGRFDQIDIAQASGEFVAQNGAVRLRNFTAQAAGGTASGDLLINTGGRSEINAQFRNVDVGRLLSAVSPRDVPVQGVATGEVNLTFPGTNVQLATGVVRADVRGTTSAPGEEGLPVTGDVLVRADRGNFQLQRADLTAGATELTATGSVSPAGETDLQVELSTERAQELQQLLTTLNIAPGVQEQLESYGVNLAGELNFTGAVRGRLAAPSLEGRISLGELRAGSESLGSLSANLNVSPEEFVVREGRLVESDGGGIQFAATIPRVEGRTGELTATIENYGAENFLALLPGLGERLRGQPGGVDLEISGQVNINGIPDQLRGMAQLRGGPGQIRGQQLEAFTARATFSGQQINLEELSATLPTGRLAAQGQVNVQTQQFDLRARGENIDLALIESLAGERQLPPVTGSIDFTANVSGELTTPQTYQVQLSGTGREVTIAGRSAGQVALRGGTENGRLNLELTTGLLGEPQTITAQVDLTDEQLPFTAGANLTGADLTPVFAALLPPGVNVEVSGQTTGTIRVEGNLFDDEGAIALSNLRGTATLSELQLGVEDVRLSAASPVSIRFDGTEVFLQPTRFTGSNTDISVGGTIALSEQGRQNLTVDGRINLRVLNGLSPDTFFSGLANLDARLTGTFAAPELNGTFALTDATVSALVGDERLTISNIDGRIAFTPGRAQISSLTGVFGGGTLSITGGAQLKGLQATNFQLQLTGNNVSVPFPNDFDTTADLNLSVEGSPEAQQITGTVQLDRVAYTEPIELADLLEGRREESIEAGGNGGGAFGTNTTLDISVTGRDALVVRNNLAEIVGGSVSLQIGGTVAEPLVSGRITARTGTVTFRGDQSYELQRAIIELQGTEEIDPLVDIQATSEIQGYQVTVRLTGPLSEPRLILQSDPALPAGDVVALITTGQLSTGVTTASTLAQSSLGTAASLLTETFVNPPIQRATGELFGLNRFEIDPVVSGLGASRPTLRLSAGRQFNRDLSVIYATNVTGEPNQTITVEYRISDRLLFVAQYEQGTTENLTSPGDNFTFEVRYRKRFSFRSLAATPPPQPDDAAEPPAPPPDPAPATRPKPKIAVEIRGYELSEDKQRELLPPVREQTAELSAIVEGARRLRNRLQEEGYFFAEVTARCSVAGTPSGQAANEVPCEEFVPEDLGGRAVTITYVTEQNRRFDLTDVRIEGTNKLSYEDLKNELRTREDSALGFLPFVSGRGYTSDQALERDRRTIIARMRELGYRRADVSVRRGVSVDGEDLIVTFVVNEGPLTRVADYTVRGNVLYTAERLREVAGGVTGAPLSRSEARGGAARILAFYRNHGYFHVEVDYNLVELPALNGEERVRVLYTVEEGERVFIRNVRINGNVVTDRDAILKVIRLSPGEVLQADDLVEAERSLYATDAFRQVIIRTEEAGATAAGFRQRDVVVDVEELKPYVAEVGLGYSTDRGVQGSLALRTDNLFGTLQQGAARIRLSPRLQLVGLEYYRPRWLEYGDRFAPLAVSVQYQRDTTVTNFFRSVLDRGGSEIVQRFDEEGNPIDQFGQPAGVPSINRFLFNVETQRDFMRDVGPQGRILRRSTLYLRYNYEDVRLFNIDSLLLAPLLRADRVVRLSRLGATFVRDTRASQLDASRGDFLSLDYAVALRQLGGNISSQKFRANYYRFYTLDSLGRTVLAANTTLGLANIFDPRDRNGNGVIDDVDRTLPISERFFAGGANSLRGFGFEEAGPRVVIPGGVFRDQQGNPVTVAPFAVPVGGNALAVLNLEARVPLRNNFQVVPFYDGGNVFRNFKDIFGSPAVADPNLNARWTNTLGLGLRITTPVGPFGVDFGYLLDPPEFLIPQAVGPPAIFRPKPFRLHIRFGQAF